MNEDYKCVPAELVKLGPDPQAMCVGVCDGAARLIYGCVYKFIWSSLIAA